MNALLKTTGLAVLLVALVGLGLWQRDRSAQSREIEQLRSENDALQVLADRLRDERRRAEIVVTDQTHDENGRLVTDLLLVEFDRDGNPLPPKPFRVLGDEVHVRSLIVEFPDDSVEVADPLRGQSIALLTGLYGQYTAPADATPIDPPGAVPAVYQSGDPALAAFEQSLWTKFWQLADVAQERDREQVKTAYGLAPFFVSRPGQIYTLLLDPDAGLSVTSREIPEPMKSAMSIETRP